MPLSASGPPRSPKRQAPAAVAGTEAGAWLMLRVTAEGAGYQLDFVTPGMTPAEAISRNLMRETPKRRM